MEKLAETRMGYNEVTFLSDRVCGICGFAHSTAYTTSVENAMGIQVPERAQMIRAILLEVERLHSHLLNLGLACHFTGFDSGFMQFFRVRETSMKMAEILTGARKTYGLNLIGGIRRDLLKDDMIQTRQLAQQMRREVQELVDVLLSTPNMEQRTVGIGRLDPEIARDFSNVGPMVRASGHARDTRADHPFVGYGLNLQRRFPRPLPPPDAALNRVVASPARQFASVGSLTSKRVVYLPWSAFPANLKNQHDPRPSERSKRQTTDGNSDAWSGPH